MNRISLYVPITPMVRKIMITLVAAYVFSVLLATLLPVETFVPIWSGLALNHEAVFGQGKLWTLITYGWMHDLGPSPLLATLACGGAIYGIVRLYRTRWASQEFFVFLIAAFAIVTVLRVLGLGAPLHLGGNLLILYFFGHTFEERWGPRRFLLFWLLCVIGGGLFSTFAWMLWPDLAGPGVVGASAGAMGLIAAFAVYFADQNVAYGFVVPIKGKYILFVAVVFDLIALLGPRGIAVFAHFGGILAALALCTGFWRPSKVKRWMDKKLGKPKKKTNLRLVPPPDDDDEPPRYLH